jgi:hypothetical protein
MQANLPILPPDFVIGNGYGVSLYIYRGHSDSLILVTSSLYGLNATITLTSQVNTIGSCTDTPTVTISPSVIQVNSTSPSAQSNVTVSVPLDASIGGCYDLFIIGTSQNGIVHSLHMFLTIDDFDMALSTSSLGAFQGSIAPEWLTVSFRSDLEIFGNVETQATVSPLVSGAPTVSITPSTVFLSAAGVASTTLFVSVGQSTPVGTYAINVTATLNGDSHSDLLQIQVFPFSLASTPSSFTVTQGGNVSGVLVLNVPSVSAAIFASKTSIVASVYPLLPSAPSITVGHLTVSPVDGSVFSVITLSSKTNTSIGAYQVVVNASFGFGGNTNEASSLSFPIYVVDPSMQPTFTESGLLWIHRVSFFRDAGEVVWVAKVANTSPSISLWLNVRVTVTSTDGSTLVANSGPVFLAASERFTNITVVQFLHLTDLRSVLRFTAVIDWGLSETGLTLVSSSTIIGSFRFGL